jgi:spermidine synthase
MIPWLHIDTALVPGGGAMKLARRGAEFSIRLGQVELMNSRLSGSEEALASLAAARLEGKARPRILIGGLGMGFTLRAALAVFGQQTEIIVAELVPALVDWARGPMAELFGGCLDDPRVTIEVDDVGAVMRRSRGRFDAILLDVDNGPEGLTRRANDGLYALAGLGMARAALAPEGFLLIWSQGPDDAFARRFGQSGFLVEEVRVKANRARKGARHVIWIGRKGKAG